MFALFCSALLVLIIVALLYVLVRGLIGILFSTNDGVTADQSAKKAAQKANDARRRRIRKEQRRVMNILHQRGTDAFVSSSKNWREY